MRWVLLPVAVAVSMSGGQAAPVAAPVPVVVELFTSEGCSSCPPADHLLSKLLKDQPVPGVEIISLGLHVTYWDRLGWKDPASSNLATQRQQDYSRVFGEDRVYTPQAVVAGREELVGSDERGVTRAIARAARQPHVRVTVTSAPEGDAPGVRIAVSGIPPDVKERLIVTWLVVEDGLTSVVKRGENGGRTLHHDSVVRYLSVYGIANAKDSWADRELLSDRVPREWRRENLRAVVLVQGEKSRRIWGAATTPLK